MRPSLLPQDQFPFTSRWIDLPQGSIHYVDEGSGPTLLFVHAGPVWSFVFRGLIERLRQDFRCVALDFPGSGLSTASADYRPAIPAASGVLTGFVDALGLDRFTLLLNDLGAPVALGSPAAQPGRVQGIVVAEGFGWSLNDHNPKVARILRAVGSAPARAVNGATNFLALGASSRFGLGRHLDRAGRAAFRGPYRDRQVRRNALLMLADAARSDDFLRKVDEKIHAELSGTPLLLVFGQRSPAVREGFPEQWRQRFPGAGLLVVPRGHHFPQMDDPQGVADAIRAWWQQKVASGRAVGRG